MQKMILIRQLAKENKIPQSKIKLVIDLFIQQIREGLLKERVTQIKGLGVFRNTLKPRRIFRNIRTREEIFRPAEYTIQFKPGSVLRKSLKK